MYFRQARLPDMGCASYLIGNEGECAIIDPRWDMVRHYIGLAKQQGLRITHIFETHTHADHVSGATRLAAQTGAAILIHRNAQVMYAHRDVVDGEEIIIGALQFTVIHTPGHSLDSISLLVRDPATDEPPRLLSGDTLFAGDVGRPDLHGHGADNLAELLYESLHNRLLRLDDRVEVYPGHLAGSLCGRRIAPDPSTTIGRERAANPALTISDQKTFVTMIVADLPPRPPNVDRIVQMNRTAAPLKRPTARLVTPEEAASMLDVVVPIDGRDPHVFAQGHIKGAVNIPIGAGQFGLMAAWLFSAETPLLLIAADEEDLSEAIDSLVVVAMTNPLSALLGEPELWKAAKLPLTTSPHVAAEHLAALLASGAVGTVLDVREEGEVESGMIEGAVNFPYRAIRQREALPPLTEPVAVICNSGNRSSVAASLLARLGLRTINVLGGTAAWQEAGQPLVRPGVVVS